MITFTIPYLIIYTFLPYKASGGKPVSLQRSGSFNSPKEDLPEDAKEICNLGMLKQSPATGVRAKSNDQSLRKSFVVPNIVPRDISGGNDSAKTEKETVNFSRTRPGMLLRPVHIQRASTGRCDAERLSADMGPGAFGNSTSKLDSVEDPKKLGPEDEVKESCEDKHPIQSVTDKFEKAFSLHKNSDQDSRKFLVLHQSRSNATMEIIIYHFTLISLAYYIHFSTKSVPLSIRTFSSDFSLPSYSMG